ncbi:hypothetical protein F5B17DRAFT_32041 [Nemania serpens]|nr:hypothetical protein F5B17DRAFT_32041 [Nemania serpens]
MAISHTWVDRSKHLLKATDLWTLPACLFIDLLPHLGTYLKLPLTCKQRYLLFTKCLISAYFTYLALICCALMPCQPNLNISGRQGTGTTETTRQVRLYKIPSVTLTSTSHYLHPYPGISIIPGLGE